MTNTMNFKVQYGIQKNNEWLPNHLRSCSVVFSTHNFLVRVYHDSDLLDVYLTNTGTAWNGLPDLRNTSSAELFQMSLVLVNDVDLYLIRALQIYAHELFSEFGTTGFDSTLHVWYEDIEYGEYGEYE